MTIITNTFQVVSGGSQAVGVREELSDIIYNIDPTETPLLNNAGRGKVQNSFFEWQTDALAAASTSNVQIEGDDLGTTFDSITPTVRLGNYTQISRKSAIISGTEEAVDKAGRKSERAYQIAKKGKELRRDMEAMLCNNIGASAGTSSAARISASLLAFIKTNINKDAGGTAPVYTNIPTSTWTDSASKRTWTETILKDVVQQCWTAGAKPKTIMVGALGKQQTSTFSGIVELTSIQKELADYTIIGAADAYVSDFGTLAVVPNRFQRTSDAFIIDWDYIEVDYLRPFFQKPLAPSGDAEKALLLAEYGLRVKSEKALGVAKDLTPNT